VKKTFLSLVVMAGLVAMYGFMLTNAPEENPGKKIFVDAKCNNCHNVAVDSIAAVKVVKNAPDLSSIGTKLSADTLKQYLSKQVKLNDKLHIVKFNGSEEDFGKLISWLGTLNAPETKAAPANDTTAQVAPTQESK
jgi:hypothetical protein